MKSGVRGNKIKSCNLDFLPTCGGVRWVIEGGVDPVLTRLSFVVGRAVDRAADAQRNQQPCQGGTAHVEVRVEEYVTHTQKKKKMQEEAKKWKRVQKLDVRNWSIRVPWSSDPRCPAAQPVHQAEQRCAHRLYAAFFQRGRALTG